MEFGIKYKVQSLIFRRYRQELLDNHVYPFFKKYPHLWRYFNKSELILFDPATNVPIIKFGYADRQEEIYKEQGNAYALIFIDEATQSTQEMIEWLSTSNRDAEGLFPTCPKMILTMNPGGVGHAYIKRIFIDRSYVNNEDPFSYFFIQASVWDNVQWCKRELLKQGYTVKDYYDVWSEQQRMEFTLKHSNYAKRLSNLPEELRKAYLYGDWEVFAGMFFKGFNRKQLIVKPFEIDERWTLIGSLDPGYSSPCSFGLNAQDFMGNVYRIATYYEQEKNPVQHADDILTFLQHDPIRRFLKGRMPETIVAGHDAWAQKDRWAVMNSEATMAQVFAGKGLTLSKAKTARIPGWWTVKSLIPDRLRIFEKFNEPLLREMGAVLADDKQPEDIQGKGNDPAVSDHCLHGDTLVQTINGDKRIKDLIGTEGYIKTVNGQYTKYHTCRLTQKNVQTVKVSFEDGTFLICTPDHKILTRGGRMICASDIAGLYCIVSQFNERTKWCTLMLLVRKFRNLMESVFIYVASIFKGTVKGFTLLSGNITMEADQRTFIFTTKTAIDSTIKSKTLKLRKLKNIFLGIQREGIINHLKRPISLPPNGTGVRKESNGTEGTITKSAGLACTKGLREPVFNVVQNLMAYLGRNFVPIVAKANTEETTRSITYEQYVQCVERRLSKTDTPKQRPVRLNVEQGPCLRAETVSPYTASDVYCLVAEDTHVFATGNGVIVSNSLDEFRYGCMALPKPYEDLDNRPDPEMDEFKPGGQSIHLERKDEREFW